MYKLLIIMILCVSSVSALSPTLEFECCNFLRSDGLIDEEKCGSFDLSEENCNSVMSEWDALVDELSYPFSSDLACCQAIEFGEEPDEKCELNFYLMEENECEELLYENKRFIEEKVDPVVKFLLLVLFIFLIWRYRK